MKPNDLIEQLYTTSLAIEAFKHLGGAELRKDGDDWSAHDGDDFSFATNSHWVEFGGRHGVAVIAGEAPVKSIRPGRKSLAFAVLKPDIWEEYGYPHIDYEVEEITTRGEVAIGAVAKLLMQNEASIRWDYETAWEKEETL